MPRVTYGSTSFLLAADIEAEAEAVLASNGSEIQSTVLKVAHHGSGTSSTQEFLEAVDLAAAVISVGESNPFGHPNEQVVERLLGQTGIGNLYRTDRDGEVEFATDGRELWVNTER